MGAPWPTYEKMRGCSRGPRCISARVAFTALARSRRESMRVPSRSKMRSDTITRQCGCAVLVLRLLNPDPLCRPDGDVDACRRSRIQPSCAGGYCDGCRALWRLRTDFLQCGAELARLCLFPESPRLVLEKSRFRRADRVILQNWASCPTTNPCQPV